MATISELNQKLAEKKYPSLTTGQKNLLNIMWAVTQGGGIHHVRALAHDMVGAGYTASLPWVEEQAKLLDDLGLIRRKTVCRLNGGEYKTEAANPFLIVTAIGRVVMEMIANERK